MTMWWQSRVEKIQNGFLKWFRNKDSKISFIPRCCWCWNTRWRRRRRWCWRRTWRWSNDWKVKFTKIYKGNVLMGPHTNNYWHNGLFSIKIKIWSFSVLLTLTMLRHLTKLTPNLMSTHYGEIKRFQVLKRLVEIVYL